MPSSRVGDVLDGKCERRARMLDAGDAERLAEAALRRGPQEMAAANLVGPEAEEVEDGGRDSVRQRDGEVDGRGRRSDELGHGGEAGVVVHGVRGNGADGLGVERDGCRGRMGSR